MYTEVMEKFDLLDHLQINIDQMSEIYADNPNFRAIIDGYAAEIHFKQLLHQIPGITESTKPGDQNRNQKGDRMVMVGETPISIEVKSVAKNSVKQTLFGWTGRAAVKSSDKKVLTFSDGSQADVANLPRGQFTILAVCCQPFNGDWKQFQYCLNSDLPHPESKSLTPLQQNELISTGVYVEWPPVYPFTSDLQEILTRATVQAASALQEAALLYDAHPNLPLV